jgi:hypothetical protein
MPSYTSSSEARNANRAIVVLLTGLLTYCVGLEVVTRLGLSRVSRIQKRISQDLSAARSIAPRVPGGTSTILVVGNSLLLEGVDRKTLKSELAPNFLVDLLPIENTQYEDWYFGLRRLFGEGARPRNVVICLSSRNLMSRATNGEYFAYYLMRARDLLSVKKESQLDNTMTSSYFFANRSMWLGSRSEIRNWLSGKITPNWGELKGYFPAKTPPMPPKEQVVARVLPHLLELDLLCRAYGAVLVVVIPPTLAKDDGSSELQESAAPKGIPVVVPLDSNDVAAVDFSDGFHLNRRGAERFTPRLSSALLRTLNPNSP